MFRDKRLNYCLGISLAVNLLFIFLAGSSDIFHTALMSTENLHPITLKMYKPIPVVPAVVPPVPIKPPEQIKPPVPIKPVPPPAKPPEPIKRTEPIKPAPQTIKPPTHIVKLPAPIRPPAPLKFAPRLIKRTVPIKPRTAMKFTPQSNSRPGKMVAELQDDNSKIKPAGSGEKHQQTSDNNDHSGAPPQQDKPQKQAKEDKPEEKHDEEVKPKNWVPIDMQSAKAPDDLSSSVSADGIDASSLTNTTIIVRFDIDEQGHASNVRVTQGSGNTDMDRRCEDAVRHAHCQPAIQDHIPRVQRVTYTFNLG